MAKVVEKKVVWGDVVWRIGRSVKRKGEDNGT